MIILFNIRNGRRKKNITPNNFPNFPSKKRVKEFTAFESDLLFFFFLLTNFVAIEPTDLG
jgi:hypothetical protein